MTLREKAKGLAAVFAAGVIGIGYLSGCSPANYQTSREAETSKIGEAIREYTAKNYGSYPDILRILNASKGALTEEDLGRLGIKVDYPYTADCDNLNKK